MNLAGTDWVPAATSVSHHADRGGRGSAGVIAEAAAVALERGHHDRHIVACLGWAVMAAAGLRRVVGIVLAEKGSLAMGFSPGPGYAGYHTTFKSRRPTVRTISKKPFALQCDWHPVRTRPARKPSRRTAPRRMQAARPRRHRLEEESRPIQNRISAIG